MRPEPEQVEKLFDALAPGYDRFNAAASLGLDKMWRSRLARELLQSVPQGPVLDAGCGTGDLIFECEKRENTPAARYIGADLSLPMLREAQGKAKKSSLFMQADCARLPLASDSVSAVMSAFVLRNLRLVLDKALQEMLRVLKPGGEAFLLEMTVPRSPWLKIPHRLYLEAALPLIGRSVFGARWSRGYLAQTILQFWPPQEFSRMLLKAGFREAGYSYMTGGLAVLYHCKK